MTGIANYCEITPETLTRKAMVKREPAPTVNIYNLSDFHKDLATATKGRKRDVIAILCKKLSKHGDFSDFALNHPEAFERLQAMKRGS